MKRLKHVMNMAFLSLCEFTYKKFLGKKSRSSKRILLYTDSRGTEVSPSFKQGNPFFSYLGFFNIFDVEYQFCPEKFTSILDFIEFTDHQNDFFITVLHTGIVDLAPRPISSYKQMLEMKMPFIIKKGWQNYFEERDDYNDDDYYGEKTISFFSEKFLKEIIIPILKGKENLIYVGINPVLTYWNGNYWRERPSSINKQLLLDKFILQELDKCVDISCWEEDDIKRYTVDNVHYNSEGLKFIGFRVNQLIAKLNEN